MVMAYFISSSLLVGSMCRRSLISHCFQPWGRLVAFHTRSGPSMYEEISEMRSVFLENNFTVIGETVSRSFPSIT